MPDFGTIVWFLGAVVLFRLIWKIGLAMLKSMATPPPPPPPAGEMRRIDVRYRCIVCGTELRMVMAPDEDPPPPKHCMEEMEFMTPRFE